MAFKSTILFNTLCFLFIIEAVCAFNFKSLIFGETDQENMPSSTSATFGTPAPDYVKSTRSDIPCKDYICEDTGVCVKKPIDCPCRSSLDKKCMIGDWYICINNHESCEGL
ncbi:uncharacterized protein EV154DRAFT_529185 [Mucor mucedo]|uniref:uncharacterized protein n=1 Tax=Mucor mucedo TaxID=29922 RepID=UPI00221E8B80|nr:uncharacterized protein EV154DRAFT_529185 [Mucor mucedo]KAI7872267.1 hypothetical protein EV154DRAFT_529185 [Mucor mucedo]